MYSVNIFHNKEFHGKQKLGNGALEALESREVGNEWSKMNVHHPCITHL
jgi:hypothetical protein